MNQPAYLEKVVLALASHPTWFATVILWHVLLSLSLRQASSSSHTEYTALSSRLRHKTQNHITERSHIHQVGFMEKPIPHPGPNDAIVKTTKALICTAEKTITTGLCPGGRLRMERLLRVLEMKRVDPTLMTTHTFPFDEMERAFEIMDKKLDGVLKPLIVF
jgi:hypothetical protein